MHSQQGGARAVFVLDEAQELPMAEWDAARWAVHFSDPANTEVDLEYKGLDDRAIVALCNGLRLASGRGTVVVRKLT